MKIKLSEQKLIAIEYLAKPDRGGLSYEELAEKIGVDVRTLRRWRNEDDDFYEALKTTIVKQTADDLPRVMASIPDIIISTGNAAMYRTFMQSHGLLTDRVEVSDTKHYENDTDSMKADIERMRRDIAKHADNGE